MLRINVSSTGLSELTFNELEKYDIPRPPSGFDSEINDTVVIKFEDEQEAIAYSQNLDEYAESIDQASTEYLIITDIINAISNDEFVQAYISS